MIVDFNTVSEAIRADYDYMVHSRVVRWAFVRHAESANPQQWAYDALNALVSLKRDLESRSSAVLDKASGRDPELANLISQMRETQIASVSNAIDYLRTRLDIK